jgi:tetratricopeptide (TPR) repeat protein
MRAQGRYDAAIRELLKAVQADPSNYFYQKVLGDVYAAVRQDTDAAAAYERVIALQPRYWAGYLNYGVLHYNRGRYEEAAALIEQLVQWAPDNAQALAALGGVYVAMRRNAEAEVVSRRSCSLQPGRTCHLNLGIALQRQRRSEEAIAEYEQALRYGNPTLTLFLNMATAHTYLGRLDEARDYFRRAIASAEERLRVNLQDSTQRAILAYCLAHTGESARARFEIEQALQHAPDERAVQRYAVLTFERLGDREQTLNALKDVSRDVLEELEASFGTEQLQKDPRYQAIAEGIRSQ